MDWRLKAQLLVWLERLPGGQAAYTAVQDLKASRGHDADEMLSRSLDLLSLHREAGGPLSPGFCVEVGTGWSPWVPLLLRLSGATRVLTLDVNPWLSHNTSLSTTRDLIARVDRVAPVTGRSAEDLRAELTPLLQTRSLLEWLGAARIEYQCPGDARHLDLPPSSVDSVLSSNVLEHVSAGDLVALHTEALRVLRPGGLAVHRFNPQDHFAAGDRSITGSNFLQFSRDEWQRLGGDGLAPHNRLRCVQHAALVRDAGFEIVVARTRPDARARQAIESGQLRVHHDFSGLSAAELSDDYMWLAARATKSDAGAVRAH